MADTHIIGWKLDRRERAQLLVRFPPHWPDVIADHVTLARVPRSVPPPARCRLKLSAGWMMDRDCRRWRCVLMARRADPTAAFTISHGRWIGREGAKRGKAMTC